MRWIFFLFCFLFFNIIHKGCSARVLLENKEKNNECLLIILFKRNVLFVCILILEDINDKKA